MCLIAIMFQEVPDAPLIVGANREEFYARGGESPAIHVGKCRLVAGRDPVAGGTWLGINEWGLVAAVTNRRKSAPPQRPRSRGILVRELLDLRDAGEALAHATRVLEKGDMAGCNLLVADRQSATVIHAGDWLRVRTLPAGVHVLSANDVDDDGDPRIALARSWLLQHRYSNSDECVRRLMELCGRAAPHEPAICLRGLNGGTVSSSILVVAEDLERCRWWHAQGPPDKTPFQDYSHLVRELRRPATERT